MRQSLHETKMAGGWELLGKWQASLQVPGTIIVIIITIIIVEAAV